MKELRMVNGDVVDAHTAECPECGTPRDSDRYQDQWIEFDSGVACPTCGTEVEDDHDSA